MGGANTIFSSPDSCKFLHDRSDYKHGWQIERELEEGRYGANGESPVSGSRVVVAASVPADGRCHRYVYIEN